MAISVSPVNSRLATGVCTDNDYVTPSDSTVLNFTGLYIGVSGNLVVEMTDGTVAKYDNHPVGYAPICGIKVLAATSAGMKIQALKS